MLNKKNKILTVIFITIFVAFSLQSSVTFISNHGKTIITSNICGKNIDNLSSIDYSCLSECHCDILFSKDVIGRIEFITIASFQPIPSKIERPLLSDPLTSSFLLSCIAGTNLYCRELKGRLSAQREV